MSKQPEIVVITGASAGVGRATAREFAKRGASIALLARSEVALTATLKAILANKIFPGYLDRYLARNGYDAQQTSEPADPRRPNNLWASLPKDFGAHGRFASRARTQSAHLWLTTHRAWFAIGTAAVAACGAGIAYTIRRWSSMPSLWGLGRMALRRRLKLPGRAIPFASLKHAKP